MGSWSFLLETSVLGLFLDLDGTRSQKEKHPYLRVLGHAFISKLGLELLLIEV